MDSEVRQVIECILFDLDGVLVYTKDHHHLALNSALREISNYIIPREEHEQRFCGLPTKKKLNILVEENKISREQINKINELKQKYTTDILKEVLKPDINKIKMLSNLWDTFCLGLVTNSIKSTTNLVLDLVGIKDFFDIIVTNEDIKNPKPNPEPYIYAMNKLKYSPLSTLIIEDSDFGYKAAIDSKANVLRVLNPEEVTYDKIMEAIRYAE